MDTFPNVPNSLMRDFSVIDYKGFPWEYNYEVTLGLGSVEETKEGIPLIIDWLLERKNKTFKIIEKININFKLLNELKGKIELDFLDALNNKYNQARKRTYININFIYVDAFEPFDIKIKIVSPRTREDLNEN